MRFVHQHSDYITSADGRRFVAQVYARERDDRAWEAWCVFFPAKGDDFVTTDRETTQSTFDAVRYWASGLTHHYFEGALDRALSVGVGAPRHQLSEEAQREEAAAYAIAAEQARERAHELALMQRAMRRGVRFG